MSEFHKQRRILNVIIDWSDDEVWDYIRDREIPVSALYAEGWTRLGCVGCPLARSSRAKTLERWPKIRDAWERGIRAHWRRRVERGLPIEGPWATADSMVDWWFSGGYRKGKVEDDCAGLFDNDEE